MANESHKVPFCVPGDVVCDTLLPTDDPGDNVRLLGDKLIATTCGVLKTTFDTSTVPHRRRYSVTPLNASGGGGRSIPRKGDVVLCRVLQLGLRLAKVSILALEGRTLASALHGEESSGFRGLIRKEDAKQGNIDALQMRHCFRVGDLVLARVLDLGVDAYFLTTAGSPFLGVVLAFGTNALNQSFPMIPIDADTMMCPNTGVSEKRLVARPLSGVQ